MSLNHELPNLRLSGLKLFQLKFFHDARGFFAERYVRTRFQEVGLPDFVQDNHSRSKPGVVRALHYQHSPGQGKLVSVLRGCIWDVVVDLRKDSPTFGQVESIELSEENGLMLWIPGGFAHGFCVLGNQEADVIYKVDVPYNGKNEGGIRFDDPDLNIKWPHLTNRVKPIISDRDLALQSFAEYKKNPVF